MTGNDETKQYLLKTSSEGDSELYEMPADTPTNPAEVFDTSPPAPEYPGTTDSRAEPFEVMPPHESMQPMQQLSSESLVSEAIRAIQQGQLHSQQLIAELAGRQFSGTPATRPQLAPAGHPYSQETYRQSPEAHAMQHTAHSTAGVVEPLTDDTRMLTAIKRRGSNGPIDVTSQPRRSFLEFTGDNKGRLIGGLALLAVLAAGSYAVMQSGSTPAENAAAMKGTAGESSGRACYEVGKATVEGSGNARWLTTPEGVNGEIAYPAEAGQQMPVSLKNTFDATVCLDDADMSIKKSGDRLVVKADRAKVSYDGTFEKPFTYDAFALRPKAQALPAAAVEDLNALATSDASKGTLDQLSQALVLRSIADPAEGTGCGTQLDTMMQDALTKHYEAVATEQGLTLNMDIIGVPPLINKSVPAVAGVPDVKLKQVEGKPDTLQIATQDGKTMLDDATVQCTAMTIGEEKK